MLPGRDAQDWAEVSGVSRRRRRGRTAILAEEGSISGNCVMSVRSGNLLFAEAG
jgi:hypothetical protein